MRILLVKLGSIGDIVHALPALAVIRRALPDAEISWVVERRSAEMIRDNQFIDNLIEIDTHKIRKGLSSDALKDLTSQIKGLRNFRFDVSIDLQGLLKSAMIGKLAGAERRFGFAKAALREPSARLLLTDTVEVAPQIHVIRKNLALVAGALGISVPDSNFEFPVAVTNEHSREASAIASAAGGRGFALLNPAGGWVTKLWHPEKFGELADRLWAEKGIVSVVVTGPKEDALAHSALSASRSGRLYSAQPSLKGFYELAKMASVYVGGDTGPTHLAVAAGTPVVGIFGPTEWWRNGSPRADDICVERLDIGCRVDCHRRKCSNWICMDTDVDAVYRAVSERLETAGLFEKLAVSLPTAGA